MSETNKNWNYTKEQEVLVITIMILTLGLVVNAVEVTNFLLADDVEEAAIEEKQKTC